MKTSAVSQDHMMQPGAMAMQVSPAETEALNNAPTPEATPWFDEASEGSATEDWSGVADDELLSADEIGVSGEESIPELSSDERSEEHTSELQSRPHLVCRLLLEKKKK